MKDTNYTKTWLLFLNIIPDKNNHFNDLVEIEISNKSKYTGAWANIIVVTEDILKTVEIATNGLKELGFKIKFIDKIENTLSLIEYDEIDKDVIDEIDWLLSTNYVFKISDKIFPYE